MNRPSTHDDGEIAPVKQGARRCAKLQRRTPGVALAGAFAALALTAAAGTETAFAYTAYAANRGSDTVTPVDSETDVAGTPINVGSEPWGIAITPDGRWAYVADHGSAAVTPIELATDTPGTPINVGAGPTEVAITPDGTTAYVCNESADTVTPIELATGTPGAPIKVGGGPVNIAITPDGRTVYVVNATSNGVTPIDVATNTPGPEIEVGKGPTGIAITPDGSTAYVSNFTAGSVTPISLSTDTAGSPIGVAEKPENVAIGPDGRTVYVPTLNSASITPISTATNIPGTPIAAGGSPGTIAITPDGRTAFVGSLNGTSLTPVSLDGAGAGAGPEITVGTNPYQVAVTPDQAPVARFTMMPAAAGSLTTFDASASTVAYGRISSYRWNFGDGDIVQSSLPTARHGFAHPGAYTVSLTETDSAGTSTTTVFTGQTMSRNGGAGATASASLSIPAASPKIAHQAASPLSTPLTSQLPMLETPGLALAASTPKGALALSMRGYAAVLVSCPAAAPGGCRGTVSLRLGHASRTPARRARAMAAQCTRGCRPLGQSKYEARAGQKVRVRVHIASVGRRLLARHRLLNVEVLVTSVSAGRTATTTTQVRLRRPRRALRG